MASSTVTRSSAELTDDVDETALDDEDFDLDDEGDDEGDDDTDDTDGSTGTGTAGDAAPATLRAEIRALDSDGALIAATSRRTVVLLGVPGVVVVDTPDALLVTTPEHAQDVKSVVDALKAAGREDLL